MRTKEESELYISDDNIKRMTVKTARVEELIFSSPFRLFLASTAPLSATETHSKDVNFWENLYLSSFLFQPHKHNHNGIRGEWANWHQALYNAAGMETTKSPRAGRYKQQKCIMPFSTYYCR